MGETRIRRLNRQLKTLFKTNSNGTFRSGNRIAKRICDFIQKTGPKDEETKEKESEDEEPLPCTMQRIIIIKAMADPARGKFVSTIDRDLFTKKNLQQIFLKAGAIVNNMKCKLSIRRALHDRLENMQNLDKFRKEFLDVKYPVEYPEWKEITTEMRRYVNTGLEGLPEDRKL